MTTSGVAQIFLDSSLGGPPNHHTKRLCINLALDLLTNAMLDADVHDWYVLSRWRRVHGDGGVARVAPENVAKDQTLFASPHVNQQFL